ncbi:MAG TPA: 50S ribosomal protein L11 methyltransferase [Bacteroidales bacterium]|nr:50S ribosomal protein L11 methyltransferase [Bacteroidales bacterium]
MELHCIIHAYKSEQQHISDILVAQLSELGYQSFMETATGLKAYIPEDEFDFARVQELPVHYMFPGKIDWQHKTIPNQNWNSIWEKNFKPVVIDDQCRIRAPFHTPEKMYPYDIVIEPKMSFGTGHHPTTSLMIRWLLETDLQNKQVLDMGSGTGILSILASAKGAQKILAIDHEEWAYQNALENVKQNKCKNVQVIQGTINSLQQEQFDVILANINLNILLQDTPDYAKRLKSGGILVVSGIYQEDMSRIIELAGYNQLQYQQYKEEDHWVAVAFKK